MKKVLIFGMTFNPGGVENVIMNYYRNINRKNIQFDFLCNCENICYEEEILKGNSKIFKITPKSKNFKKYKKEIKNFFKKNSKKYDCIWINVCNLNNIDYLILAKKYGIKKRIVHAHNSQSMEQNFKEKIKNKILHNLNKYRIEKYATDFWSCSESSSRYFYTNKIRKSENYLIINNAINTSKFRFDNEIREEYRKKLGIENNIVLGNVGRMTIQKNQDFIIDILNVLKHKSDKYKLILVGEGNDTIKLEKKVTELNLNNDVLFLGVRDDISEILQAMDIFIFPSRYEGLPLSIVEAKATGINIIASKEALNNYGYKLRDIPQISLNENIDKWIENIDKLDYENRNDKSINAIKSIKNEELDIIEEAKKLEKKF